MKRFLKTLLLFFLPMACLLGILEYGMRSVPNNHSYKKQWLDNNIPSLRIWSFGTSHGHYGIYPKYFSKLAFNSAYASQSLTYDAFIFNKFIDRADSLEWVILPISYHTLVHSLENSVEWWRVKNYCIYYECPYHRWQPKYNFEIVGNPMNFYEQIKRVLNFYTKGTDDIFCDSLGFNTSYSKENRVDNWYMGGKQIAQAHTKDLIISQPIIQENIEYMKSIIQSCAEKQVKVLLLTIPVCSTYYDCVDSAQYTLMVNTCENFANTYGNVQYLNLFKDSRFVKDDFHDSDHLATEGAEKLTRILDKYIAEH